jgi:hypothetical protein
MNDNGQFLGQNLSDVSEIRSKSFFVVKKNTEISEFCKRSWARTRKDEKIQKGKKKITKGVRKRRPLLDWRRGQDIAM